MSTERKPLAVGDWIYIYGVDSVTHDAMRVKAKVTEVNGDKIFALAKGAYKPVAVHRRQCVLIMSLVKSKRVARQWTVSRSADSGPTLWVHHGPTIPDGEVITVREVLIGGKK